MPVGALWELEFDFFYFASPSSNSTSPGGGGGGTKATRTVGFHSPGRGGRGGLDPRTATCTESAERQDPSGFGKLV